MLAQQVCVVFLGAAVTCPSCKVSLVRTVYINTLKARPGLLEGFLRMCEGFGTSGAWIVEDFTERDTVWWDGLGD